MGRGVQGKDIRTGLKDVDQIRPEADPGILQRGVRLWEF